VRYDDATVFGDMKEPKPRLKLGKGKWYVGMSVPEKWRHILGGQHWFSTGTSDRNEARKRPPPPIRK